MRASSAFLVESRRSGMPGDAWRHAAGLRLSPMENPAPNSDVFDASELICAVARQDKTAFARLFQYFAPRIKAMLMRKGTPEQRAEDLAQEAMMTVWRKAGQYNPEGAHAAAWIFTIARNRRIDQIRQQHREVQGAETLVENVVDETPLADARVIATQDRDRLHNALDGLSSEQMTVVRLSFFEDRPHPEIAKALGIPIGTVKSRLRLAMGRLRNLLDDTQ